MKSFRLALVGGGGISRAHVAACKASEGRVQIVAAADPLETARRGLADATGAQVFESAGEMIANSRSLQIQGILICTPPSARIDIVKQSLQAGLPTLAEKPIAHNVGDAKLLADAAKQFAAIPSAVAYCHRFVPAVLEMKKQIASGNLGQPVRFENTFAGPNPGLRDKWMSDPKLSGGGSFIDTGCHSLDLYRFLFGDAKVTGAVYSNQWAGRGESNATVLIQNATSVAGIISSGWVEPGRFTLTVVGGEGLLSYDYDKPTEMIHYPSKGETRKLAVESHDIRFDRQLVEFARFAETGVRGDQLASFEDGRATAQLVDEAQRLAKSN